MYGTSRGVFKSGRLFMNHSPLTSIQKKILSFIEDERLARGIPPTLRAIQQAFGFRAIGTVQDHLRTLVRKGVLEKEAGRARSLRVVDRFRAEAAGIPILGAVTAGVPREADEQILGMLPVPAAFEKKGKCFALRVVGESMIDAGIHDGDLVIARQQSTAKSGEIVVALVDGETTVKRLEKKDGRARLLPENPAFAPIEILSDRSVVQGRVVAVFRDLEGVI